MDKEYQPQDQLIADFKAAFPEFFSIANHRDAKKIRLDIKNFLIHNKMDFDEETSNVFFKKLSSPKYENIEKTFFEHFFDSFGLKNAFKIYNFESFKSHNHIRRFQKHISLQISENKNPLNEIQEYIDSITDPSKKYPIISSLLTSVSIEHHKDCHDLYFHTLTPEQRKHIALNIFLYKDEKHLSFYEDFWKTSLLDIVGKPIFVDAISKNLTKNKIDIIFDLLKSSQDEISKKNRDEFIIQLLDKSILNKRKICNYFVEKKVEEPEFFPSSIFLVYIYRSILIFKKEESIPMVRNIFQCAHKINEFDSLVNLVFDSDKEHNVGIKFNMHKSPSISLRLKHHLQDILDIRLSSEKKDPPKFKI